MPEYVDMVEWVTRELEKRPRKVKLIAKDAGVGYDTVWRIANRITKDPGYRVVVKLASALGLLVPKYEANPACKD